MDSTRTEGRGTVPPSPLSPGGTVLLVATDPEDKGLRDLLENESLQILAPASADDAFARARARQPDLILIDASQVRFEPIDLPNLIEELKSSPYTSPIPLVLVSPSASEELQLAAFRHGADDFLIRPKSTELLKARLRALTRRYVPSHNPGGEELVAENLLLDSRSRRVTVAGVPVALTRKEFDLLNLLLRKRGTVVYTTYLYHTIWGGEETEPVDSHTVKVHVSSLRGKLGPKLGAKIVNLPGLGYRFEP